MKARRLEEIRLTGTLPSPTGVGLEILRQTSTDDYCISELARTLQADPALTGRIIKLANSSGSAGFDPSSNVEEAALRLGVRTVRNLALGFSLVSGNRSGSCEPFDYEAYWSRALASGLAASGIAERTGVAHPADAFTCALLAGIGELSLASVHPEAFGKILLDESIVGIEARVAAEREAFDTDHCELAIALLLDWKLPESFAFAVGAYGYTTPLEEAPSVAADKLRRVLAAADCIGRACSEYGPEDLDRWIREWPEIDVHRELLGLDPSGLLEVLAGVGSDWPEWGNLLQISTRGLPSFEEIAEQAHGQAEPEAEAVRDPDDSRDSNESDPAREGRPMPRNGLRILAVDDAPVSLRLLVHHLTQDGHTVIQARDGREALALAMSDPPQLVVSDWMMPEMDGVALCKALRRTSVGRGMYVLILTAREDEERIVEAFDAGADDYVVKPFNPKILLARVRAGQRMIELREQVEFDRRDRAKKLAEMGVLNRKLRAAAYTDPLTELPNRRYAMKRIDQDLSNAQRSGGAMSVMMLDIDHFKRVNDEHGHDVGDFVLRETANTLRRTCRRGDVVCRLGGEEFLVICPASDLEAAATSAERIRAAVEANLMTMGTFDRNVTVSIGVAQVRAEVDTVDALIKESDLLVYEAKESGRNRVCFRRASDGAGEDSERKSG